MKQADNEWVVATGLMAALAAVLVLLLAVHRAGGTEAAQAALAQQRTVQSVPPALAMVPTPTPASPPATTPAPTPLQPTPSTAPAPAQPTTTPAASRADTPTAAQEQREQDQREQGVTGVLRQVQNVFAQQGASRLVAIDTEAGTITLKEGAFRRGSACVEPEARAAFAQVEQRIADYLKQNPAGRIYVEGHTDDKPVKAPVTDVRAYCTVYDDNITLSAARAREARLLLIGRSAPEAARRVIVAGYGDSQPLPGLAASDERNRRVEVRFIGGVGKN
ncbi:OmpA family protein [Herbaspirillum sp. AP02]|uniref:OmpA/MotB family protein n=1 Tax=unclassified Herbaspirillum TaxID=2624150 RepID=UPI0015DAB6BE|nr:MULTISPECIES: OmpA family protein [unclassified Herbaspirillum]MBG7620808.1 OmpA family protein [Herbaspirillum sp. AP02]NZD68271.1 OmpA family protein [Herbaspirillum sp. AP21]